MAHIKLFLRHGCRSNILTDSTSSLSLLVSVHGVAGHTYLSVEGHLLVHGTVNTYSDNRVVKKCRNTQKQTTIVC